MEFRKYQHIERFGTTEVENIEFGDVYVFPKIDGTNASIWLDNGRIQAGSRKRHLSLESDNAGFLQWATQQDNIIQYLIKHPNNRLYGEWLVPHSLKTYREDAWRKFYVFDIAIDKLEDEIQHEGDSLVRYIPYDDYKEDLSDYRIDYIPPISIINNASYDQIIKELSKNIFLIEDGKGSGEGVVLKNYSFTNKYRRQTWAKIITSEFKEKHAKEMGAPEIKGKKMVEEDIAEEFVTKALCDKVYAKIEAESGFNSRTIPRLLSTVFYDVVNEESWNFVKKHRNPTINYNTLQHFVYSKVKEQMPNIF